MNWLFLLTSFLFSLASFSTNMSICYFLVFCHKGTRANFVWNWLLWKGSFKKYLIRKMAFLDLLSPMSHVANFFFHPSLPVSFTKKWQTMAWNRKRGSWTLLPLPERLFQLPRTSLRKLSRSGIFNDFDIDFPAGIDLFSIKYTAWKTSKYGVFSGS